MRAFRRAIAESARDGRSNRCCSRRKRSRRLRACFTDPAGNSQTRRSRQRTRRTQNASNDTARDARGGGDRAWSVASSDVSPRHDQDKRAGAYLGDGMMARIPHPATTNPRRWATWCGRSVFKRDGYRCRASAGKAGRLECRSRCPGAVPERAIGGPLEGLASACVEDCHIAKTRREREGPGPRTRRDGRNTKVALDKNWKLEMCQRSGDRRPSN